MKPATVAPLPMPKLPATRPSANKEARCSGCDQGETQNSVRGARDAEPGAADDRADEGLPGTVDECEARVAESRSRDCRRSGSASRGNDRAANPKAALQRPLRP